MSSFAKKRVSIKDAEKVLAHAPPSPTGHGALAPFPYADREEYKSKHSNEAINAAIKAAPVVSIPLKGLHAIQHSVKPEQVDRYLHDPTLKYLGEKHPKARTPIDHPIVIQSGGKRYIHDGHHRATSALLRGDREFEARFVNLDEK